MLTSGYAAPVLRPEDSLTAEQLRAAAAAGYANPCINAEAAYALTQQAQRPATSAAPEQKPA